MFKENNLGIVMDLRFKSDRITPPCHGAFTYNSVPCGVLFLPYYIALRDNSDW